MHIQKNILNNGTNSLLLSEHESTFVSFVDLVLTIYYAALQKPVTVQKKVSVTADDNGFEFRRPPLVLEPLTLFTKIILHKSQIMTVVKIRIQIYLLAF